MKLSERKNQILCMAIEEYIKDCAPITSGSVKDKAKLECSTATLRNELNALEAMGYLKQLHTSGGRIPTAQGYRYYVENLLSNASASNGELEEVKKLISSRTTSLTEIVSGIAKIVSHATSYPTVVMMNGIENLILDEFKIIPMLSERVMVLIGTKSGYISQEMAIKASPQECQDASNYLTKNFKGESIGFMIDNIDQLEAGMKSEIKAFKMLSIRLLTVLKNSTILVLSMCIDRVAESFLKITILIRQKKCLTCLMTKKNWQTSCKCKGKKKFRLMFLMTAQSSKRQFA